MCSVLDAMPVASPGAQGRKRGYDRQVSIDPDLGAVLLAVSAGVVLAVIGRSRRVCESCGRRVRSALCTCEREVSEAIDAVERAVDRSK
jgi:hypothetical protein